MSYPFDNEKDWHEITVLIEVPVKPATTIGAATGPTRIGMRVTLADLAAAIRARTPRPDPRADPKEPT